MPFGFGGSPGSERNNDGSWSQRLAANFCLERDPNTPRLSLKLLREMWELTTPYWTRPGAWVSYLVLSINVFYTFGSTVVAAKLAKFGGDQLDALAKRDSANFYRLLILSVVIGIATSLIVTLLQLPYEIMMLRWRQWFTERFVREYLQNANYYALNRDRAVDNPDERIAIDIAGFVRYPVDVLFAVLQCVSTLVVFGQVLWSFGWYLVPACAGYYAVYSASLLFFSKPILNLSYAQRRLDGDFRFSLVNVRVNAESVAFLRGEPVEQRELFQRLRLLIDNFVKNLWWSNAFSVWLNITSTLGSTMLPSLLIAPLVLKGRFTISAFTQTQNAWSQLGSAFGFIGDQALNFAYGGALIARLYTMHEHMVGRKRPHLAAAHEIVHLQSERLAVSDFTLYTPGGERVLIEGLSLDLQSGVRLLVTGPNGAGKSSLLRGLAGLWTRGSGKLYLPPRGQVMFLPQRPYMSLGTFREQLTYPDSQETFEDAAVRGVLQAVNLGHLEERVGGMDVKMDWMHVLSPGEQQRLAVARALLRRSKLVILDEATSAVDMEGEQSLYRLLQDMGCTYLSVAHRGSLYPFHDQILELKGDGAWEMRAIEHASRPEMGTGANDGLSFHVDRSKAE